MGYDYKEMKLVYFGGGWGEGPSNETYVLDLKEDRWMRLETDNPPSNRMISRMVFVPEDGFLLFGGATPSLNHFNDTWVLSPDAKTWVELQPTTAQKELDTTQTAQGITGFPPISILAGLALLIVFKKYWK